MFLQKKQTSLCRLMILIDMEYNIISTGSKGNAVVINDVILIDCGVSFRALKDVYKNIKIVLLTHIHSDHFNRRTIKALANNRPTLRFAAGVHLLNDLVECGVDKSIIDVVEAGKSNITYKAVSRCTKLRIQNIYEQRETDICNRHQQYERHKG